MTISQSRLVILLTAILTFPISVQARSLQDRVADGPAAKTILESFQCLQQGDRLEDEAERIPWYERGRALAERALEIAPNDSNAHFAMFSNWGRIVVAEGLVWNAHHIADVQGHLDRTLELDPDHPHALAAKGALYFRLPRIFGGDPSKAEALLLRAAGLDPRSAGTRVELASFYLEDGQPGEALRWANEALVIARREDKPQHVRKSLELLAKLPPDDTVAVAASRRPPR